MTQIELRPAWTWDCPECGAGNVYREQVVEDPEIAADIKRAALAEGCPEEDFEYAIYPLPERMRCIECKQEFDVPDYGDDPPRAESVAET